MMQDIVFYDFIHEFYDFMIWENFIILWYTVKIYIIVFISHH